MLVCAHGAVSDFCKEHGMVIVENYTGDIENYKGVCRVIVTAEIESESEYYYLKGKMLANGIELISTKHKDCDKMLDFLAYNARREAENRRQKYGGRHRFGFNEDGLTDTGRAVVKRIFELRDAGYTLRAIRDDEGVYHPNGKSLSTSTIQVIVKNREKYEREGL